MHININRALGILTAQNNSLISTIAVFCKAKTTNRRENKIIIITKGLIIDFFLKVRFIPVSQSITTIYFIHPIQVHQPTSPHPDDSSKVLDKEDFIISKINQKSEQTHPESFPLSNELTFESPRVH